MVKNLGYSKRLCAVGSFQSLVSCGIGIYSCISSYWLKYDDVHYGLWEYCDDGHCSTLEDQVRVSASMQTTRGLTIGFLALCLVVFLCGLVTCMGWVRIRYAGWLALACMVKGGVGFSACAAFSYYVDREGRPDESLYGIGVYSLVLASFIALISGLLFLLAYCKTSWRPANIV
eukprot:Rmarinus@m.8707